MLKFGGCVSNASLKCIDIGTISRIGQMSSNPKRVCCIPFRTNGLNNIINLLLLPPTIG